MSSSGASHYSCNSVTLSFLFKALTKKFNYKSEFTERLDISIVAALIHPNGAENIEKNHKRNLMDSSLKE